MLAQPPVSVAREIVGLAQRALDGREICPRFGEDDLDAADAAMSAARRALYEYLEAPY